MHQRRVLSLALVLGIAMGLPAAVAVAKQTTLCEFAEKVALKKALKSVGASIAEDVGGEAARATGRAIAGGTITGMDAVVEYFTHPDDTRLDAAMHKLLEGGTKIVFPTYGLAVVAGRFVLGSSEKPGFAATTVEHVVEAARSGQLDAFICGDSSYDNLFAQTNFFDLNAVRAKGITCDNFTQRVHSFEQLEAMRTLWFGYYKSLLLNANPGRENGIAANEMLDQGWARLENSWKVVWAEKLYLQMREALKAEARAFAQQQAGAKCIAAESAKPAKPTPDPCASPTSFIHRSRRQLARSVHIVNCHKGNAGAQFGGSYTNAGGTSTITISGTPPSVTAHEVWAAGGRNGANDWSGCGVTGSTMSCNWTGTYLGDPDKTGTRRGTVVATVSGNRLTGKYLEDTPTFRWKVAPYASSMHKGAVWPIDHVRK